MKKYSRERNPKRILLVSPFPPTIGGISISVHRLSAYLEALGYKVEKYNTRFPDKYLDRIKALKLVKYLVMPFWIFTRGHFDVIHFHVSGIFPKIYASLWRRFFSKRTRFVITIHGEIRHLLESGSAIKALGRFDRIICVKKGDREIIPDFLKSRTVEIPAFIPPEKKIIQEVLPPGMEEFLARDSFKLLLNGFITCDGRYKDLYGFRDSAEMLRRLRAAGKNVDLIMILIGTGNNRECSEYVSDLRAFCRSEELADHIFWVENQNIELWPLIPRVQALLRPTKSDGDALSIRESLYFKKPVVSSDVVPRPEGTVVYNLNSIEDFFQKTLTLINNYDEYISGIGDHRVSFAGQIVEQYENK